MNNAFVLIILYDKQLSESKSVVSLFEVNNTSLNVLIFNNGPNKLKEYSAELEKLKNTFLRVDVKENLENIPLSIIYNDYCKDIKDVDYYIFDDDTDIPKCYFDEGSHNHDLVIPQVYSLDGVCRYPRVGKEVLPPGVYANNKFIYSPASGILINSKLVKKVSCKFGSLFDEDYSLYGVDISLFRRIHLIEEDIEILIDKKIDHNLSLYSEKMTVFRREERLIDNVISLMKYPKSRVDTFYKLTRMLIKRICLFRFREVSIMFKYIFKPCHQKSLMYKR